MIDTNKWLKEVQQFRFNPSGIQRIAYQKIEAVMGGRNIADPTNPFSLLLEATCVNTAAAMVESEANTRKQYPSMALTEDELYLHMSDADYLGRFAAPSRTSFRIFLGKDELFNRVVETGVGGSKKLVIPRHTEFTIAGVKFTMQYPIEVRVMAHGGLQVVYDVDQISPLQTLSTNIVEWTIAPVGDVEFLVLTIPVSQFQIKSNTASLNLSSGFVKTYSFEDQFYFARAYYALPNGQWKEMKTTHTDQVFDPTKPTLLLKVNSGKLTVTLPQVYVTTGQVTSELRVDVYTTRGPLDMLLSNYNTNNFTVAWNDLDSRGALSQFVAPLTNFPTMSVFSDQAVVGGTNGLTFAQLRERTITNSLGSQNVPISNAQLTTRLSDMGYDAVKFVDNITRRQYKATRTLPRPADESVISGAGCTIQTLTASMATLSEYGTVIDNGNRITLLPKTLYQNVNGVLEIVPEVLVNSLLALPVDVRARRINESRYVYSPFHYVLDKNNDRFEHRGYYLDSPKILSKSFVEENDSTGIEVSVGQYGIVRTVDGYRITLVTRSGASYKDLPDGRVFCQLSYRPTGERDRAYLNGTLQGVNANDERIYTFEIGTNYDIDENHFITLDTFSMYDNGPNLHATALTTDFDVVFVAEGLTIPGLQTSAIDDILSTPLLPSNVSGVTQERLSVEFGTALTGLWTSSRSVPSSLDYERYEADVPLLYTQTIFERDSTGAAVLEPDGSGGVAFVILHNEGDPVLDENDDPVFKFRVGDVKIDLDGFPVIKSTRQMVRQIDILLIDGAYWFATESSAVTYRESLPVTIVSWLIEDIAVISKNLLERTELFFYPKSTLGNINALVLEGQVASINAEQSFAVTYYLSGVAYRDSALRASLTDMAVETINDVLQKRNVTVSEMTSVLRTKAGLDAIATEITGLGGSARYQAITLQDDSARLSIKKKAYSLADGTIGVQDDVDVAFLLHSA